MSQAQTVLGVLAATVALLPAATVHAQVPTELPQPIVGQPGKDVVWVPTPLETVEAMLDLADVTSRDFVVDLGSGDGRMVIAAARRGARALGVEYNPELVELSKRHAAEAGVSDRASFVQGDMYEADFSQATALALFLLPHNLQTLTPKFLALEPGTRIVVNTFGIPNWEPEEEQSVGGECASWCRMLLYIVPARAQGTWRLPQGTLTLAQEFQRLSGTLQAGDQALAVEEGRLRGEEIHFVAGSIVYNGRIAGQRMEGTITAGGRQDRFVATRVR